MPDRPLKAIIFDFDGTITSKDTISTLFEQAIALQSPGFQPVYNKLISEYTKELSQHLETYQPCKENRSTLDEEIAFYRSLKPLELKSFSRVSTSHIFRGISRADWYRIGQRVIEENAVAVRNGFSEVIKFAKQEQINVGVVSVNFSRHFIRGVLNSSAPEIEVRANWTHGRGILFGPEGKGEVMATSDGKLTAMDTLLREWGVESGRVVYVGDSGTDIECLTRKGVIGIVMAADGESTLIETLKRVGVRIAHLSEWSGLEEDEVYWAKDFRDIVDALHK